MKENEKDLLHKRKPLQPDYREGGIQKTEGGDRGNIPGRTAKTGGSGSGGGRKSGSSGNKPSTDVGYSDTPQPDSGLNDVGGSCLFMIFKEIEGICL